MLEENLASTLLSMMKWNITIAMFMDEKLDDDTSINQTNTNLKIIRVVPPKTNQNSVDIHQK